MNFDINNIPNDDPKRFIKIAEHFLQSLREHKISFAYEGEFTQQITIAFSALAESSISKADDKGLIQRRVNFVVVECMQNITKHAEIKISNDPKPISRGIFMLSKSKEEYGITTGNIVERSRRESLQKKIDYINNLSREEINELYMKQISEGELSEVGGAGLGFIDIVRRTARKLNYHFLDIDENTSFFILTSFVSRI